jgi:2-polyprenyl-3-methyl-5-hydroxy-6-metoxy-1,4-benzoquinol methylase
VSWRKVVPKVVKRPLRKALNRWRGIAPPVEQVEWFRPEDIDEVSSIYFENAGVLSPAWDPYRHSHMILPAWFRHGLDPWSAAYAEQQHRLWALVAGRDRTYVPAVDEKEHGWENIDAVRAPAFYIDSASDHILATGMLLKHSGLQPGDHALEYGAGFGQTALTLARMGVNVDTVDISSVFCEFVRQQAEHFAVPLTAFHGIFGMNPRPGQKYKLIWFYESFHHCVDFMQVVPQLAEHLAEGGRIVLGGEPIVEKEYAAVPYPWGVRLHSEVAVVMRKTGWFELGFSEAFLYELFRRAGFAGRKVNCEPSLFGRLYIFERVPQAVVA